MKTVCAFAFLMLLSVVASAQTVLNPTKVQFTPSADHDAVIDGVAIVAGYELRHFIVGASSPVQIESLGKPAPVSGTITAPITAMPFSTSLQYVARVAAVGPTGEGISESSNPYFFVGKPGSPASVILTK